MDGNGILSFLLKHKDELLTDVQFKHCVACAGPKLYRVYRSPLAAELGTMLEKYEKELRPD